MRLTRRHFVGSAAALGAAAAIPWPARAQSHPVRRSLGEFTRDPFAVASLRKGIAAMKARAPSDHKSWFFQAAIHAYNDALYADALARDPAVANVDAQRFWNKCPHFGQSSADFLIWHRAYLYNFERILRDAIGDPLFALPYWDYSKEQNRGFPEIFASEFLDTARQNPNPLYHPNREQAFVTGRFDISDAVGDAADTMAARIFFSDVGETGFAGDVLDSRHTQLGMIEQRPHNDIHIAVGGVIGTANGAMADVPTAAFDPVFWVHHTNIDRLWAEWSCMPGKGWGPLPSDAWLDEQPWEFLDVDGGPWRASRRFFIARISIAVFYDTDRLHGPPMELPPPAVMAAAPMARISPHAAAGAPPPPPMAMMKAPSRETELVADATPFAASPLARAVHALPRPRVTETQQELAAAPPPAGTPSQRASAPSPPVTKAAAPLETVVTAGALIARRVLLELSDITFARVPSSGFAVYLANDADVANKRPGTFVGLIDLFGVTHAHMTGMGAMGAVQRFDVTRIVAREGLALTIHVEPYDLLVSKNGSSAPKRTDAITIGKVRFVQVS